MSLDRIVHAFYAATLDPSQWSSAFELLGDELGGCAIGTSLQRTRGLAGLFGYARIDPHYFDAMVQKFPDMRANEMVSVISGLPAAVAVARQAVKTDESYFNSALYNEIFAPQDLAHSAVACAFRSSEYFVPFGILRRKNQEELGQREFDILKVVLPHLERAILISLQMGLLEKRQAISDEFLERLPFGVVLLDGSGTLKHMNSAAQELVTAGDGLKVSQGKLHADCLADKTTLQQVIAASLHISEGHKLESGTAMKISRPSLAAPYLLLVIPTPRCDLPLSLPQNGAIVFIIDPDRRVRPDQAVLMQLFDLTPAESRIALYLAGGDTLDQAGRKMGIARNTARVHVKRIFRKMDINRQGDLIRTIINLAAVSEHSLNWPEQE